MARVSAGWVTLHASAARVKLSDWQSAMKYLTWCSSMPVVPAALAKRSGVAELAWRLGAARRSLAKGSVESRAGWRAVRGRDIVFRDGLDMRSAH